MVNCSLFWANQRQRWNENPKCWFDCCSNDLFGVYHLQTQCKIDIDKTISHLFCLSFFGRVFIGISTLFVSQLQKRIVFAIANRWDYTHFFFCFYSPCVKKMMICHHAQQNRAPLMWHIEIYDPVCGCDDITYSNTCTAEASGVLRWTQGACADWLIGKKIICPIKTHLYNLLMFFRI